MQCYLYDFVQCKYYLKLHLHKNLHKSLNSTQNRCFKNIYVNYCWNFPIVWEEIEDWIVYMLNMVTDIIHHWYYIYWVLQFSMLSSKSASHLQIQNSHQWLECACPNTQSAVRDCEICEEWDSCHLKPVKVYQHSPIVQPADTTSVLIKRSPCHLTKQV